ncbi:MAG TPA: peptidoglycan-binding protein, partial [Marinobacter sp.]|nr:peptidoglycan-binding protein [Marinobacter sp.]
MIRPSARRNYLSALAGVLLAGTFAATPVSANEVVALKNALYGAGYEIKNVTPEMDAATRAALESYQQSQALMVTGELDAATRESLG